MKIIRTTILLLIAISGFSQNQDTLLDVAGTYETDFCEPVAPKRVYSDTAIFSLADVPAKFPGGLEEMLKFINKEKNPSFETREDLKVYVLFTVERDGSISQVETLGPNAYTKYAAEAIRIIKLMPLWTPALYEGKTVRLRYVIPVMF